MYLKLYTYGNGSEMGIELKEQYIPICE